jgi:hypothetical protein
MRSFARRLLVLLLSVALATGLTVRFVDAGTIEMTAMSAAADMLMHGKCDGCAGNEKAMAPTACSTYCAGLTALPAIVGAAIDLLADNSVRLAVERAATGHAFPPDPYPPRPIVLS